MAEPAMGGTSVQVGDRSLSSNRRNGSRRKGGEPSAEAGQRRGSVHEGEARGDQPQSGRVFMKDRELTARRVVPRRLSMPRQREAHAPADRRPLLKLAGEPAEAPVWDALRGGEGLSEAAHNRVVLRRDAIFRRSLATVDVASAV